MKNGTGVARRAEIDEEKRENMLTSKHGGLKKGATETSYEDQHRSRHVHHVTEIPDPKLQPVP